MFSKKNISGLVTKLIVFGGINETTDSAALKSKKFFFDIHQKLAANYSGHGLMELGWPSQPNMKNDLEVSLQCSMHFLS